MRLYRRQRFPKPARLLLMLAFFLLPPSFLWSAGQGEAIPLNPEVRTGILSNGLRYYVQKNSQPREQAILRLGVNAGSLLEDEDQLGMAHFLEHMAFNGTREYKANDIIRILQDMGMQFGPDINAHTAFDETVYKLAIPLDKKENLDTGLNILEQWAFHMTLTTKDIEEERGVILEEWRRGLGAGQRMMNRAYPDIMYKSLYGERLPIGTKESIEGSSPEAIRRYYRDWYRPELMSISAVGDFDPDVMVQKIRRRFSPYKNPPRPRERQEADVPEHEQTIFSCQSDPEATWTAAVIFNKLPRKELLFQKDYREKLIQNLYSQMFNNRLIEIQNSPDPPFSFAAVGFNEMTRDKGFHTMTVVSPEGELKRGFKAILTEAKRIKDHGFTAQELERAKKELRAGMLDAYNNRNNRESAELADLYVYRYLEGNPAPGMEYRWALFNKEIDAIPLKEIQKAARTWLTSRNRVVYTMSPEKPDLPPVSEAGLARIMDQVKGEKTEPPAIRERAAHLMDESQKPLPGKITGIQKFEEIGVEEWTLSNGARVWLKKTDFKENEILFSAMAPGGTSLAEDEDYLSASFSAEVVNQSGAGGFSELDLEQILAGSTAFLQPRMGELSSGTSGRSSREDLETLLQLNYLYFTEPGLDKPVWKNYMDRMEAELKNRDASPMTRYSDLVTKLLYQDNFRTRPLTVERLKGIHADRAFAFYRERFADASGYTFFFTGNFDRKELRSLTETYLASLPAKGLKEEWKDRGLRYPKGIITESLKSGREPLSHISLIYPGTWTWSPVETQILSAVADSLQIVITEEIREKSSGAYSPGVSVRAAKVPFQDYCYVLSFSCDPRRARDLLAQVKAVIRELKTGKIEGRIIEDVIKARSLQLKEQSRRNGFWQARMERAAFLKLPPEEIQGRNDLAGNYDQEVFRDRLKRYFHEENRLEIILYPEDGKTGSPEAASKP